MEKYYVYAYCDKTIIFRKIYNDINFEYLPIYIGKGKGNRMYNHFSARARYNTAFYNKINKMICNDNEPLVIKLKEFDSEKEALEMEILLIKSNFKIIGIKTSCSKTNISMLSIKKVQQEPKLDFKIFLTIKQLDFCGILGMDLFLLKEIRLIRMNQKEFIQLN